MRTASNRAITITASARSMYLGCPRSHYWRVQRELVPAREEDSEALRFGTLWHAVREARLRGKPVEWPVPKTHEETEMVCRLIAMDEVYCQKFGDESKDGWQPEQVFRVRLPGHRGVWLAGKVDGIKPGMLIEHKTTASLSGGYIDRLPVDGQILHYCLAQRLLGNPINRVVYDVAVKPALRMGQGETEEEYQARKADLEASQRLRLTDKAHETLGPGTPYLEIAAWVDKKFKPSTAERKIPETMDDYILRLYSACQFVREELYVSDSDVDRYQVELTELVRLMRYSQKKGLAGHLRNDGHCTKWGRVCGYLPLCRSDDPERLVPMMYQHKAAHSELLEDGGDA
jgi:hypothetical protein